jgi:hypothetical protein
MSIKKRDGDGDSRLQSSLEKGRKHKSLFKHLSCWITSIKNLADDGDEGNWSEKSQRNAAKLQETATLCQKVAKQKTMESQKRPKEFIWRAKRPTRGLLTF